MNLVPLFDKHFSSELKKTGWYLRVWFFTFNSFCVITQVLCAWNRFLSSLCCCVLLCIKMNSLPASPCNSCYIGWEGWKHVNKSALEKCISLRIGWQFANCLAGYSRQQWASSVLRQINHCVRAPKGVGGSPGICQDCWHCLEMWWKAGKGKLVKLNNAHSWIWALELKVFPSCQMISHENPAQM